RKKGPSAPKFDLSLVYLVTCPPRWGPLSAGRPDSREEGSGARTPRATGAPHYVPGHPAAICHQGSCPRSTCGVPRSYLPSTTRRPAPPPGAGQPDDHAGDPILHDMRDGAAAASTRPFSKASSQAVFTDLASRLSNSSSPTRPTTTH